MMAHITEVVTDYEERVRRRCPAMAVVIIFGLGFGASFFYCHVPLIARSSVMIFRLRVLS